MYIFWIVILAALLAGITLFLYKSQQQNRRKVAERSAPLPVLDSHASDISTSASIPDKASTGSVPAPLAEPVNANAPLPPADVAPAPFPASASMPSHNWLNQVRRLREKHDLEGALLLCEQNFPKVQALQQAAITLRQQMRANNEEQRPSTAAQASAQLETQLKQLYRIAVLADLFRNSNAHKPRDPLATYLSLAQREFDYQQHGTRLLRLLTKNDIRQLEQLWGHPQQHAHAEEILADTWRQHCR